METNEKRGSNRGILIAILVCLILLVFNQNNSHYNYDNFPSYIETNVTEDKVIPVGEDKIVIYNHGEVNVFRWDEEGERFNWLESFYPYDRIGEEGFQLDSE
ncbi:hypothetical protein [Alkalihalobacillus pseudalcaliphilus]|uniref:hypothetical protein n=1 Tax=Alkalihalobacillus pseudalcaliphilus TaxID=79884 RepID=UPI00064E0E95|nr:hypothetical protein [Alkalihalobacillus pseudalcaliphilus]KMK75281.1 hypothetical protein AB990_17860 [Alkalihalobacillus pseudalcaliphilus]